MLTVRNTENVMALRAIRISWPHLQMFSLNNYKSEDEEDGMNENCEESAEYGR